MPIRDYCTEDVVTVRLDQTLAEAAELMREKNVGCVVAAEQGKPLGVLTDRDLALAVLADGMEPSVESVEQAMERPAATVEESAALREVIGTLSERGLRRLPVVDADGSLCGVVSADDLTALLADEMQSVRSVVVAQMSRTPEPGGRARTLEEHFEKPVVSVKEDATAEEIARLMSEQLVGCVVVTDPGERPIGIVTDRDLAKRALDQRRSQARQLMSQPLRVIPPEASLDDVVALMERHSIRRIPVVRRDRLMGLVSLDDVLVALGRELSNLGVAFRHGIARSQRAQRLKRLRSELHSTVDWSIERAEGLGEKALEKLARELQEFQTEMRKRLAAEAR